MSLWLAPMVLMVDYGGWRGIIIVCGRFGQEPSKYLGVGRASCCLCLEVQIDVFTSPSDGSPTTQDMLTDTVCGSMGWQPRLQGVGGDEKQMLKSSRIET